MPMSGVKNESTCCSLSTLGIVILSFYTSDVFCLRTRVRLLRRCYLALMDDHVSHGLPQCEDGNNKRDSLISQHSMSTSDDGQKQMGKTHTADAYLGVPPRSSFRPSIGSLSDIPSIEGDSERGGRTDHPSLHGGARLSSIMSPRPKWSWRHRTHAIWARQKGVMLVLLSQLFGALMGVLTRLLETNGAHGVAMHPFQVVALPPFS